MDIFIPKSEKALILPSEPVSVRNPSGFIFVDGREVANTLQCVHCQAHFIVVKGSGRKRGFCHKCMGPTCSPQCSGECYPAEKQLEDEERKARM